MNSRQLIQQEEGQSMVEFALVLPVLILLTIGTIYLTISFTHKSRMNGLAFMTARSVAVQPTSNLNSTSEFVKERFVQRSKQSAKTGWVTRLETQVQEKGKQVEVTMGLAANPTDSQGDMWTVLANVIDIIGGKGSYNPRQITSKMRLMRENQASTIKPREDTSSVVDYRFSGKILVGGLLPVEMPLDKFGFVQMADSFGSDLKKKKQALGLQPPNEKITDFYQYVDWLGSGQSVYDFNNDEEEEGQMERAKIIGDHFKTIETSGRLIDILLTTLNPFTKEIKDIIGDVAGEAAQQIESGLNKTANTVDEINKDYL